MGENPGPISAPDKMYVVQCGVETRVAETWDDAQEVIDRLLGGGRMGAGESRTVNVEAVQVGP